MEITNKIYGKPLIILSKRFFLSSEGMFLPLFALYDNGQIIYRKKNINDKVNYFETLLNNNEKEYFINSLPFKSMYDIENEIIDASGGWTDQGTTILELNINGYKNITIDGFKREFIPENFLLIYDTLKNYRNKNAYKWFPDNIIVKLYKKPFSNEIVKEWPNNLPEINTNVKNNDKDNITLFLEKKYLKDYFEFYNSFKRFQYKKYKNELFSIHHEMEYPNIKYLEDNCFE